MGGAWMACGSPPRTWTRETQAQPYACSPACWPRSAFRPESAETNLSRSVPWGGLWSRSAGWVLLFPPAAAVSRRSKFRERPFLLSITPCPYPAPRARHALCLRDSIPRARPSYASPDAPALTPRPPSYRDTPARVGRGVAHRGQKDHLERPAHAPGARPESACRSVFRGILP